MVKNSNQPTLLQSLGISVNPKGGVSLVNRRAFERQQYRNSDESRTRNEEKQKELGVKEHPQLQLMRAVRTGVLAEVEATLALYGDKV